LQLSIRLFANLREQFGTSQISIDVREPICAEELIDALVERYPSSAQALVNVMVARNHVLLEPKDILTSEDEIALIPPVGGGEIKQTHPLSLRLSSEPLRVEEAYQTLEDINHGGTVLFIGTVREWTGARQTHHLSYEAYEDMALRQMASIQEEIESMYPGTSTLQWHRTGRLHPPDIAVICGASSPHRDNAFAAARELIERLKKEVTIWKKEIYVDGASVWQANAQSSSEEPN
jgi:MoaE-MoaD fusion protein